MENLTIKTVREIALAMTGDDKGFEEFRIDYCCGGGKMLIEAYQDAGANPEIVLQKIDDPKRFLPNQKRTSKRLCSYFNIKTSPYQPPVL